MLSLPEANLYSNDELRSPDPVAISDWIEGCLIFSRKTYLSDSSFMDIIEGSEYARNQDEAWQIVGNAWNELKRRKRLYGKGSLYRISNNRIIKERTWRDAPAYSFCLALSYARLYPAWHGCC